MIALKGFAFTLLFTVAASAAIAQEWRPSPMPKDSGLVGAEFRHDDGGALVIACDTAKHLIIYFLVEPRAHWEKGSKIAVKVRADDGTETPNNPSTGVVIAPTKLFVGEESTWDLYIMDHAQTFFATGAGGFARIFLTKNYREATDPVLHACGDHR